METKPFKICSTCSSRWDTLKIFLDDPELKLVGYQVHFEDLEGGLFYFNHNRKNCGTTLAIPVKEFLPLTARPILTSQGTQPDGCPALCVRRGDLDPCPVACECNWVREIMLIIRNREKRSP